MATIVAAQTGNWSSTATWTGGVLPGVGDVAQTAGFTVTIDQDITVTTLEPTSSGRFECGASRTINANVVMSSTSAFGGLRFTHASGTSTLNGNITGGGTASAPACVVASGGTVVINGNVTGGSASSAYGINNASSGTVTVNGTVTGGSGALSYGLHNNSTGTATATTAVGGSAVSAQGLFGNNTGGVTKAKAFQCSSQGVTPLGGFIFITDDAANNTFKFRTADDSAEITLGVEDYPAAGNVRSGTSYDSGGQTGTLAVPAVGDVQSGVQFGAAGTEYTGTFAAPAVGDVESGIGYGAGGTEYTGTLAVPPAGDVQQGVQFGASGTEFTGTFAAPAVGDVQTGVGYGAGGTEFTGTFTAPAVGDVQTGVQFGAGGTEFTGTFAAPAAGDVQQGVQFGASGTEYTGTFVVPAEADVRDDEGYGAGGTEFTGTLVVSLVEQAITADVDDGDQTKLRDFFPGTTKTFTVTVKAGGVAQNITGDAVTFRMKTDPDDTDAQAAIAAAADVATSGATGVALFHLDTAETAVTPRKYYYDVVWVKADGHEYVLLSSQIRVKDRVSDV